MVGEALLAHTREVIVENGGDVFISIREPARYRHIRGREVAVLGQPDSAAYSRVGHPRRVHVVGNNRAQPQPRQGGRCDDVRSLGRIRRRRRDGHRQPRQGERRRRAHRGGGDASAPRWRASSSSSATGWARSVRWNSCRISPLPRHAHRRRMRRSNERGAEHVQRTNHGRFPARPRQRADTVDGCEQFDITFNIISAQDNGERRGAAQGGTARQAPERPRRR